MNRTALYSKHIENGAKMTEFAGWQMPLFYSGIKDEHIAVRSSCGIFDASHMGEIEITGSGAESLCQWLVTNDLARIGEGGVQYNLLCNHAGGILDDLMVYKFSPEKFVFCVNASNTERNFEWILSHSQRFDAGVKDISRSLSLVSVQGPDSAKVAKKVLKPRFVLPERFSFTEFECGGAAFISRTGYTGEDGFEIFLPWDAAPDLWLELSSCDGEFDVVMCGLGCRDTLRLEMGYALYGNEIGENVNPFEARLGPYVKLEKGDFCGRKSLEKVFKSGARRALCGLAMIDSGIPRSSYRVFCGDREAGVVTSGTMSPSLRRPIGLAMIDSQFLETAGRDGVEIEIRGRMRKAAIADFPFRKKDGNPGELKYQEALN